jgi:ABC-2 type transport system permease protein
VIRAGQATLGRSALVAELLKLSAFMRRDFLTAWSYRFAFFSDAFGLLVQAILFYFVGLLVDDSRLPTFGGNTVSYLEFVAVGITISAFVTLGLSRVAGAIRNEQLTGTLEYLLMTPTSAATMQIGSVLYDLVYIPVRTTLFLLLVAVAFDLNFALDGIGPAVVILLMFIPFIWGLGLIAAGAMLTFRSGGGVVALGATALTLLSGAYFPLDLLPDWIETIAVLNPLAVAVEGMRDALLGGTSWSSVASDAVVLVPAAILSLAAGAVAFSLGLGRERRRGTLGLY